MLEPTIENLFKVLGRIALALGLEKPEISGHDENVRVVENLYNFTRKNYFNSAVEWKALENSHIFSEKVFEVAHAASRAALDAYERSDPNAVQMFSRAIKALEEVERQIDGIKSAS
ncbi:MAG: hypothetical protein WCO23_05090 [bacterium]